MEVLVDCLNDAGFAVSPLVEKSFQNPLINLEFVNFSVSLARELGLLLQTEEKVGPLDNIDGLSNWKLELSSFLKELNCSHTFLYEGDLESRFTEVHHRLVLIDFLLGEVLTARIIKFGGNQADSRNASSTASMLGETLNTLGLNPPPSSITATQFFNKVSERISGLEASKRDTLIGTPLFCGGKLSEEQWSILNQVAMDLEREYSIRRTMLVTRLSATLQSFAWSGKINSSMTKEVADAISMYQFKTSAFSNISVADMLAARKDLAVIAKVSSVAPETRSLNPLTKIKVGNVPDRGGRPSEQAPPPPEMPSWQQRTGQAHDQGGGYKGRGGQEQRGGFRGGRGGRGGDHRNRGVQGSGWK